MDDLRKATQFDMVVTDYKLGTHTGLDVVKALRGIREECEETVPVLVATAAIPHEVLKQLKQFEASLFLEKPFSRYELANALSTVCKGRTKQKDRPAVSKASTLSHKDLNRLLSDLGFDRCNSVVRSFQTNLPSMISGMQAKLDGGDINGLRELLHRLVSASGFVGGGHLVELTNDLRKTCKGKNVNAIRIGFDELVSESEAFLRDLEDWRQNVEETHRSG